MVHYPLCHEPPADAPFAQRMEFTLRCHSTTGALCVVRQSGTKEWYLHGFLHREDGPAIEHPDGSQLWFQEGVRHRLDGPAVQLADGTRKWYVRGKQVAKKSLPYAQAQKEQAQLNKAVRRPAPQQSRRSALRASL